MVQDWVYYLEQSCFHIGEEEVWAQMVSQVTKECWSGLFLLGAWSDFDLTRLQSALFKFNLNRSIATFELVTNG